MSKPIIEVINISKKFNIGQKSSDIRHSINYLFSFKHNKKPEIWALKDVSFEVHEGEVFGLIGPNGSGKSTLLKILSRITYPTSGKAILRGRVSSLLEVGTGFHNELTGRENIYLNGSILGMKRAEIKQKFDEIVYFSGIEQFIDTPVKHYSSGMYVRLAFSVAAHLEPEILLVDEVLSVGDLEFRQKSMGKMNEVAKQGRTVIFVSHNLEAIESLCTKGLYLKKGCIESFGMIYDVISDYKKYSEVVEIENYLAINNENISIIEFSLLDKFRINTEIISSGSQLSLDMFIYSKFFLEKVNIRLEFKDENNIILFICNNYLTGEILDLISGDNKFTCFIPKVPLNEGHYFIDLSIAKDGIIIFGPIKIKKFKISSSNFYKTGNLPTSDKRILIDFNFNKQN